MSPGVSEFLASAQKWDEQRSLGLLTNPDLFPHFLEFLSSPNKHLVHPPSIQPASPSDSVDSPPFTPQDALRYYLSLLQFRLLPSTHPDHHAQAESLYTDFLSAHATPRFVPPLPDVVTCIKRAVTEPSVPASVFDPLYEMLGEYFRCHQLPRFQKTDVFWQFRQEHGATPRTPLVIERVQTVLDLMPPLEGHTPQRRPSAPGVFMRVNSQGQVRRPRRAGGLLSSSHRLAPIALPEDEESSETNSAPVTTRENAASSQKERAEIQTDAQGKEEKKNPSNEPRMSLSQRVEQMLNEDSSHEHETEPAPLEDEEPDDESTEEGQKPLEEKKRESSRLLDQVSTSSHNVDEIFSSNRQMLSSNDTVKQETQKLSQLKEKLRRLEADIQQQKMRRVTSPPPQ